MGLFMVNTEVGMCDAREPGKKSEAGEVSLV